VAEVAVSAAAAREEDGSMKHHHFLNKLDELRIIGALNQASRQTSGDIRLFISHRTTYDPVASAQKRFQMLGMDKNSRQNEVLIFVAPKSQKFAVIGDQAIHEKCGQSFWDELAQVMGGHFRNNEFTTGLIAVIERAGELLSTHFPRDKNAPNEDQGTILED
jgi:uncharacterized membrane protein